MNIVLPEGDFEGYIFDCDGTLADTMPLHYQAWTAALGEHAHILPEALFYQFAGIPTEKIVTNLNERHGLSLDPKKVAEVKEDLYVKTIPQILPIEPVVALVHRYHGTLPMAVASGGYRAIVIQTLDALGVRDKFDAIVGAEDYTHGKPAPDPFLVAAQRLGVPPEKCLVFEDAQTGIESAKAAGMQYVFVPQPQRNG
ncbi:MAG TPA: HAD family phosphatase [Chthoniobacteraceae bacterium]|nr:HAD family phosphatase [Chthoniobacteraceae bacterium]